MINLLTMNSAALRTQAHVTSTRTMQAGQVHAGWYRWGSAGRAVQVGWCLNLSPFPSIPSYLLPSPAGFWGCSCATPRAVRRQPAGYRPL